jgi:hypothetical protein
MWRYGAGHCWVEYFRDGKCFLIEPQFRMFGDRIPRLTTLGHKPKLSLALDGETVKYFVHKARDFSPSLRFPVPLVWEWLSFWVCFWLKLIPRLPLLAAKSLERQSRKGLSIL